MQTTTGARRAHGRTVRAIDDKGLRMSPMQVARYAADSDGSPGSGLLCPFELLAAALVIDVARWWQQGGHSIDLTPAEAVVSTPAEAIEADLLYSAACPLVPGRTVYLEGYGLIEDARCALATLAADPGATARLYHAGYAIEDGGIVYRPDGE